MLRAVTYDCWNTLLLPHDETAATVRRVQALSVAAGISIEQARVEMTEGWQRHHDSWLRAENFVSAHIAQWLLSRHGVDGDASVVASLTRDFEEASLITGVSACEGAVEVLTELRSRGLGIAVVCDSGFSPGRVLRQLFADVGLFDLVDEWAFSDEVGACKPSAAMFGRALTGLAVDAADALHVGDLWRTDVCGGRAFGMRTARYTAAYEDPPPLGELDADHVIAAHAGLLDVLP
ncbi:MAG TPA: HAD family hydrolase [Mycobacteriales bacterium]|nr:HAD family hydrolase [Mycobacteriales bacterium]